MLHLQGKESILTILQKKDDWTWKTGTKGKSFYFFEGKIKTMNPFESWNSGSRKFFCRIFSGLFCSWLFRVNCLFSNLKKDSFEKLI